MHSQSRQTIMDVVAPPPPPPPQRHHNPVRDDGPFVRYVRENPEFARLLGACAPPQPRDNPIPDGGPFARWHQHENPELATRVAEPPTPEREPPKRAVGEPPSNPPTPTASVARRNF